MYFTRIRKTKEQLEIMINILELEYNCKDDKTLAVLMSKYFEVSFEDADISIRSYRALQGEDYEQQSKKVEYV